jgi:phosphoglycerol transferase MdoB-like AlkP superfamily enzyme
MIKLGAKEINPTISYLISCFGVQKGILILFMLSLLISVLFVCVIIKAKDTNYSLLATLVLVLVLFFSIVAVTGNVCGFAYVLKNVI